MVMLSGAVTTVAVVVPAHHKTVAHKAAPVAVVTKPVPTPVVKPAAPVPTPSQQPAPAPATTTTAPVAAAPAPKPIASTSPSPGTGVKKFVPTPAASPPATTSATSSSNPSSSPASSGAPAAATGGYYSTNWSGYAALSGNFTSVSGSWTVPSVTGNGSTTSGDSAWIGIGGVSASDLIQTGTMNMVAPDGTVTTSAFYELLPDAAMEITGFTVEAGDSISASITQQTSGTWNITITDQTSGQTYNTLVDYTSSFSSAEWIEEDPSYVDGSLVPFDNFSHVIFGGGTTTQNGASTTLAGSNAAPITLANNANQPVATPSVLTSGGGFWVTHD